MKIKFFASFVLSLLVGVLLFGFNNCGGVSFSQVEKGGLNDSLAEVFINCQNKAKQQKTVQLQFPEEANTCDWGRDQNLDIQDSRVRARHEQKISFDLPAGAVICDVEFASQEVSMRYDDQIFLTFNNSVLMSSSKRDLVQRLPQSAGIPQYSWPAIRDVHMDVQIYDPFCLGAEKGQSSCYFPKSEHSGRMEFQFSSELIQSIMALDIRRTRHEVMFVTTGDNDNTDCKHNDFQLPLKVTYVVL